MDITIDASALSFPKFLLSTAHGPQILDGAAPVTVSVAPGSFGIRQIPGYPVTWMFQVTQDGLIDYEHAHDVFLGGRGTATLVLRGIDVGLDATGLSHDLLPYLHGVTGFLSRDTTHRLTVLPATGYAACIDDNMLVSLFDVRLDGSIRVDGTGCASVDRSPGDDPMVTLQGFPIVVDNHATTHRLVPVLEGWRGGELRPGTHRLTLLPGTDYTLRDPQNDIPDVVFDLDDDGTVSMISAPIGVTVTAAAPLSDPATAFTTLDVRRADDLLVLRFEFVNLVLDPEVKARPRRMIRAVPGHDAFLVVHFPPQHIAEETFDFIDFSRKPRSYLSGESRLAFRLPPEVKSLPLTIAGLLDWRYLKPSLTEILERRVPLTFDHDLLEPADTETAIELPFRLVLSPHPDVESQWEHHTQPGSDPGGSRIELWHTGLLDTDVQAIWSPDLLGFAGEDDVPLSLGPKNRAEIVQISTFQLDGNDLQHLAFDNPGAYWKADDWWCSTRRELSLTELRLSALGGWLRISSRFNFPAVPSVIVDGLLGNGGHEGVEFFSLKDWRHTIAMGRDQQARVVERGFLYPFGHRADRIKETMRIFVSNGIAAELECCLIRRDFLVVQEPERRLYNNRGMPFTRMSITISRTPDLDLTPSGHFVPTVRGVPFAFPMRAVDHQGTVCDVPAVMVWVPVNETDWAGVKDAYDEFRRIRFANERLAYAPERSGPPSKAGNTAMITLWAEFEARGGSDPPFEPRLSCAEVRIPSVEQLGVGGQASAVIEYHEKYLSQGIDLVREGVFAKIRNGLPVEIPAQQAGGLINQRLALTGLSADRGAVPNVDLLMGSVNPNEVIEGLGGKLLGVIDLSTIITASLSERDLPTITADARPGSQTVAYTWKPQLRHPLPPPLHAEQANPGSSGSPVSAATLEIIGKVSRAGGSGTPAGGAAQGGVSTQIDGTLKNVALSFLDVVTVTFTQIHFHSETGRKPDFDIQLGGFDFTGDLRFLKELATILRDPTARDGRGSDGGPTVVITQEGVSAGMVIAVPGFALGVLSLRDLSFSSTVDLYFSGKPFSVRFALSSRERPFIVTYTIFGGGGHFALTADTGGKVDVEATVEFGASASINLFVAQGTVEIMVGVLFAKRDEDIELGGYIRIFGCLEILGVVSISVEFYLSLTYADPRATGRAAVTVSVRVLGFSKSVTLSVQRSFNLGGAMSTVDAVGPTGFEDSLSRTDWIRYCDSFAPLEVA